MTDSNKSIVDQANDAVNAAGAPPILHRAQCVVDSLYHPGVVERWHEAASFESLVARRFR